MSQPIHFKLEFTFLLIFFGVLMGSNLAVAQAPGNVSTNLELWLKANTGVEEAASDAAEDNDNISRWLDQSGNSRHATQGTTAARPVFNTNSANSNPAVTFSTTGTDDFLTLGNILNYTPGTNSWSFIAVYNVADGNTGVLLSRANDATTSNRQYQYYVSNNEFNQIIGGNTNDQGTATVTGNWSLGTAIVNSTTVNSYVNGGLDDPGTPGTATESTNVLIGARSGGTGFTLNGNISEIIMYNSALNAANQRDIETYLAIKYGITLNISSVGYTLSGSALYAPDATFDNDIAGIARDDSQGLNQTSSKSVNTTAILTVSGATSQDDGDFLIWGNNGGTSGSLTGSYLGFSNNGSARIWKVDETGDLGNVTLTVNKSDLPGEVSHIYVKGGDAALGSGGTAIPLTDGGTTWTVTLNFSDGDYFSFVAIPEINLTGNSITIADGDATPSATDHTDFGSTDIVAGVVYRTYTIQNTGSFALGLTGSPAVSISGANAADFTVTSQPASSVAAGGSTTFTVAFNPSALGVRTAAISVDNQDSDENPYNFSIQGTGANLAEITLVGNSLDIENGDNTPQSLDDTNFGNTFSTVTKTFTIVNNGTVDLTLDGSPAVAVSGDTEFSVSAQPSSTLVAANGGSITFSVQFSPLSSGIYSAILTIENGDLDEDPFTFSIAGSSIASPGGAASNLSLWLKADAGVTHTSNSVSAWADQSGLGNNASQGTAGNRPTLVEDELNGNDVIDFVTDDWIDGAAGFNTAEYFLVIKPEFNASATSTTGNVIGFEAGEWTSFALGPTTGAFANELVTHRYRSINDYRASETSSTKVYNEPVIFNGHHNSVSSPTNMSIKADGADIVNATVNTFVSLSNQAYRVADDMNPATDGNDSGPFDGKVAEVISYSTTLTSAQRRDVTTYLAIKYGISLDISSQGYTAEGNDIYNYTGYANDIAGLGKNVTTQGLNQTNSKSVNNGTIVRVQSPSDIEDGEYLIWGNDGGSTSFVTANVPVGAYERLGRIWRVAETGDVGTVTISFDVTALGVNTNNSTINLFIVPSSGTVPSAFSSSTVIVGGEYSIDAQGRSLLTFEGVDLSNGDYFTIGGDIQTNSPGGTSIPPSLWLRADEGVVQSSNLVSKWTDYGGGGNDVIQGNNPQKPTRIPNGINFNDALDFTGDFMDGASGFYTQDYFVVMKADLTINTTNQPGFVLGFQPNEFSGLAFGPESGLLTNEVIFQAVGGQSSGYHQGSNTGSITGVNIINSRNNAGATAQQVLVNGVAQSSTSSGTFANLADQPFRVGNNFTSTRSFDGQIAEIISFDTRLSDVERRDVETYLALKYGITLNITSAGYTDNGTVIYWYTTHPNNIAGVGQNLNNSFLQEQSMGGIVKMEFPDDLDNEDYIIWGRNSGSESTVQTGEVPTGVTNRLEGEWRVDKTGDPGEVTVKLYVAGINQYSSRLKEPSLYSLLTDADGDFSAGASVQSGVSFSGDTIIFSNVSFNDGDYFTLGVPPVVTLPGTGATVWLKAHEGAYSDAGTTLATNGGTVQQWNNQISATLTNVAQSTAGNRPTYSTNLLNGYPVIDFDGTSDQLASAIIEYDAILGANAGTMIMVLRPTNSSGSYLEWRRDNNNWAALTANSSNGRYLFPRSTSTVTGSNHTGEFIVMTGTSTGGNSTLFVNGTSENTGTYSNTLATGTDQPFRIGGGNNGAANIEVAEVIVYNVGISSTNRQTIETYLSLKYGLPKSLPLEVAGTTIYNNTSYANDVAGIGAEATLGYFKDDSRSVNADDIVSVSEPSSLNSGDYLVWGNDNGGTGTTTSGLPGGVTQRMTRIWSAVQTNDVGTVAITFDLSGLAGTYGSYDTNDFTLIIDNDNNPGNGITGTITASSYTGGVVTFTGVDFGSGTSYFSLGTGRDLTTDTDADGIPDYFEVAYGSNPASVNSPLASGNLDGDILTTNGPSADGITDALEYILQLNGATAPVTRLTDTDGDGIPDYIEVAEGSDPFNANSPFNNAAGDGDGDGLPDLVEMVIALINLNLDPWSYDWGVDTDGDGIPDDIETQAGWNPASAASPSATGGSDTDGDGVLDGIEYVLQFIDANYGVMDIGTDTDDDGAPDYFEFLNGFGSNNGNSPVSGGSPNTDSDDTTGPGADGVSDALEASLIAFGVPGPITSVSDYDGDGIPDFIEALTYTDPMNVSSPELPGSMDIRALQADYQTNGGNCIDLSGYQWIHISDNVGNLVFSINPVGHDLGATCFAVRILSGSESVRSDETHYILNRNFWITPTTQPDLLTLNHKVYLRLYTLNDENQELKDRVGEDFTDYLGLGLGDFVEDSVKFTKISGIAESLDPFVEGGDRELIDPVAIDFGSTATAYTFGVNSFSNLVPHNAPNNPEDPLPVEWLSFSGKSTGRFVHLYWSTASEENNDLFEVERSYDGTNYVVIGRVIGNGTTTEISEYEYEDATAPSGVLYYRLRQVDYDGKFDYSSVIRVENIMGAKNLDVILYPNPSSGSVYLRLDTNDHTSAAYVIVYDLFGKMVYKSELPGDVISTDVEVFNAGLLKSGIYMVNIQQGSREKTVRLIVE